VLSIPAGWLAAGAGAEAGRVERDVLGKPTRRTRPEAEIVEQLHAEVSRSISSALEWRLASAAPLPRGVAARGSPRGVARRGAAGAGVGPRGAAVGRARCRAAGVFRVCGRVRTPHLRTTFKFKNDI
jgi:hypothetical protein